MTDKKPDLIMFYRGENIEDYSKAELIDIICEVGRANRKHIDGMNRMLDIFLFRNPRLNDL